MKTYNHDNSSLALAFDFKNIILLNDISLMFLLDFVALDIIIFINTYSHKNSTKFK